MEPMRRRALVVVREQHERRQHDMKSFHRAPLLPLHDRQLAM
jgi:hypothetical protein